MGDDGKRSKTVDDGWIEKGEREAEKGGGKKILLYSQQQEADSEARSAFAGIQAS